MDAGLENVLAAETVLSDVDGAAGRLVLRGYELNELASGDVVVAATGVTDGALLSGVKFRGDIIETETIVYRSLTGTVRRILGEHRELEKFHLD